MSNTVHGDQFGTLISSRYTVRCRRRPIYNRNVRPNPQFNQINDIASIRPRHL